MSCNLTIKYAPVRASTGFDRGLETGEASRMGCVKCHF